MWRGYRLEACAETDLATSVQEENEIAVSIEVKILDGIVRLSDVIKTLLVQQGQEHGVSPIQIQILLFVDTHSTDLCSVSRLALEFNLTKATISDATRVLVEKGLMTKEFSPTDKRRYNLLLTAAGKRMVDTLSDYAAPVLDELERIGPAELDATFALLSSVIYRLNRTGVIQVQRTCFACQHYRGDRQSTNYCSLLETSLARSDIRLDCPEFDELEQTS